MQTRYHPSLRSPKIKCTSFILISCIILFFSFLSRKTHSFALISLENVFFGKKRCDPPRLVSVTRSWLTANRRQKATHHRVESSSRCVCVCVCVCASSVISAPLAFGVTYGTIHSRRRTLRVLHIKQDKVGYISRCVVLPASVCVCV